ncbi:MAG: T9SS type A sorting domain-containing protein [Ignavibacteriae bacterium]|nr:T9SS type A sorting domain-containing protein [Ignavibacteria bacterium]MBI3364795.1 T9SS type A sorting domain-containing protein [Ignavibacteriota bacterium]
MRPSGKNIITLTLLLPLLFLFSAHVFAQPGWNLQFSGTTRNLRDVFLIDSTTGVAVGDSGMILRTTNGGTTWTAESSGTKRQLGSVAFANTDTGVAVGGIGISDSANATILRTTDGGIHWLNLYGDSLPSPFAMQLFDVTFINNTTVVAVGGTPIFFGEIYGILRSTDAGTTWQTQSFGETTVLLALSFADSTNGMAVGTNKRFVTTSNGGLTWTSPLGGGSPLNYRGVYDDPPLAIIVGDSGTIMRTTDGGTTWLTFQDESGATLTSISFSNPVTGYVTNSTGAIMKTSDRGSTWKTLDSKTTEGLNSIFFAGSNAGTAVGNNGTILYTTHGGEQLDLNVTFRVHMGVQMFAGAFHPDLGDAVTLHAMIDGVVHASDTLRDLDGDSIYATTLGLKSHQSIEYKFWKTLRNGVDSEMIGSDRSLVLDISDTTLPLVYFSDDPFYPAIVAYNAGWNMVSLPRLVHDPSRMTLFPSATSSLFAFDGSGYVPGDTLKNGAGYWIRLPSPVNVSFSGLPIANDTIEVGEGWNMLGTVSSPITPSIDIVSDPPGIISSNFFGFISSAYSITTSLEPGRAYWVKVNQNGTLIFSPHGSANPLSRIAITPTLELPPSPPTTLEERTAPAEFLLHQNYPNPFNPLTVIRYSLSVPSIVTLKIYNVLGQEVATLIHNELMDEGDQEVEFDASRLASGVYFYRLIAGKFSELKKMVLVK